MMGNYSKKEPNKCIVCGSLSSVRKKYNVNEVGLSYKVLIKNMLPYFDFLIPNSIEKLKKFSTAKSPFKGRAIICSNCGHGTMENPPTKLELFSYYQRDYWSERLSEYESYDYLNDPRAINQINILIEKINYESIKNVLEIGAGPAYASLLLRYKQNDRTIDLYTCEPGEHWEAYYEHNGITKIANYFPFETQYIFDYIHTSHWLEHVLDLKDTFLALKKILKSSGYLFIEVPNTEHYYWDLKRKHAPHIHFFTRESLLITLETGGFECISIGEYGITFLELQKGIKITSDRYGAYEKGLFIRGLFKKKE